MARTRQAYPPGFRHKMVELVRAGRSPRELAQEFEPCCETIRGWIKRAECLWPDQRGAGAWNESSWQRPRHGLLARSLAT